MKLIRLNNGIKVGSVVQEERESLNDLNKCNYNGTFYISVNALNMPDKSYEYGQLIVSRNYDTVVQLAFRFDNIDSFKVRVGRYLDSPREEWFPWKTFKSTD